MTYDQFVLRVRERVEEKTEASVRVTVHTAVKNNGTRRKGLTLTEKGINIAPTIFLEEYYQRFCMGLSEECVAGEVLELYARVRFRHSWEAKKLKDYGYVKDRIVYRLVNRKANQELLEKAPFRPFLDLAIVYYVMVEAAESGTAAMMVCKEHQELWQVTEEELYQRACRNTRRILPEEFSAMKTVIMELSEAFLEEAGNPKSEGEPEKEPQDGPEEVASDVMYVLTNRLRSHGAAAVLYEGCLEKIAAELACNYYVLPSSIHEVILTPDRHGFSYEELSSMVKEINESQVREEEVLSDHAYYYDRNRKELTYFPCS